MVISLMEVVKFLGEQSHFGLNVGVAAVLELFVVSDDIEDGLWVCQGLYVSKFYISVVLRPDVMLVLQILKFDDR